MTPEFQKTNENPYDWNILFHGETYDTDTNLSNYGYRYYVPILGKWLSRDPITEQGGTNLYHFTYNNAVNKADYLGMRTKPWELTKDLGKCEKTFTVYVDTSGLSSYYKGFDRRMTESLKNVYSSKGSGLKCPCTTECPDGISINVNVVERKVDTKKLDDVYYNTVRVNFSGSTGISQSFGNSINFVMPALPDDPKEREKVIDTFLETQVPHEFGHSFGLKHPGQKNNPPERANSEEDYKDPKFPNNMMGDGPRTQIHPDDFQQLMCPKK